jgi:hypothetical protein
MPKYEHFIFAPDLPCPNFDAYSMSPGRTRVDLLDELLQLCISWRNRMGFFEPVPQRIGLPIQAQLL